MSLVWRRRLNAAAWVLLTAFLLMNALAALHGWKFTHFNTGASARTGNPAHLGPVQRLATVLLGVQNSKPQNHGTPDEPYTAVTLQGHERLEAWLVGPPSPKGTVVLFHGYVGSKSGNLDKAAVFRQMGYRTLLVDFMGSGGSDGNQTTIGYYEAEDVKAACDWLYAQAEPQPVLFGTSMGAVAILKALSDHPALNPKAVILECPFGTTLETVESRFRLMGLPPFPLAHLLAFWGGALNGFNAFAHNPDAYARAVTEPTLLLYGEQDDRVTRPETERIFRNLSGPKTLRTYPNAGHENYLIRYRQEWTEDVAEFLGEAKSN